MHKFAVRGGDGLPLLVSFQSRTRSLAWAAVLARTEEEVLSQSLHHLNWTWLPFFPVLFHTPNLAFVLCSSGS